MTNIPVNNNLIIELHVPDFEVVKSFYSKLGFEVGIDDNPTDNVCGYLTMIHKDEVGNTILNFYGGNDKVYEQAFFKQFPKDTKRGYAVSVTIPVSNIDEFYNRVLISLNDNIIRELKELEDAGKVWKDFRMADPFGFYLRFTELINWGQK